MYTHVPYTLILETNGVQATTHLVLSAYQDDTWVKTVAIVSATKSGVNSVDFNPDYNGYNKIIAQLLVQGTPTFNNFEFRPAIVLANAINKRFWQYTMPARWSTEKVNTLAKILKHGDTWVAEDGYRSGETSNWTRFYFKKLANNDDTFHAAIQYWSNNVFAKEGRLIMNSEFDPVVNKVTTLSNIVKDGGRWIAFDGGISGDTGYTRMYYTKYVPNGTKPRVNIQYIDGTPAIVFTRVGLYDDDFNSPKSYTITKTNISSIIEQVCLKAGTFCQVYLRMSSTLTAGAENHIATLPERCRPTQRVRFTGYAANSARAGFALTRIETDGKIYIYFGSETTASDIILNTIFFTDSIL